MPELAFGRPTPQESSQPLGADMKFLNRLGGLEAKQKEIKEKIAIAGEEEKQFLEMDLEETIKQIANYHDSFGKYRKNQKISALEKIAGEQIIAEVYDFKTGKRRTNENNPELGEKFLNDLEEFKKSKRIGGAQNH